MCILSITAIATSVATAVASAATSAAAAVGTAAAAVGTAAGATASTVGGWLGATAFTIGTTSVSWGALGLGTLALGGAVAGGVMSTVSGIQNAQMQEEQAEYMASVEAQNRKLALRQAEAVDVQGNQERASLRNSMLQTKGEARNAYAASGVVLGSGSSADYEADIADAYDLDSRNLEYDIASRKWKLQVEAANSATQASLYRAQASGYRSSRTTSLLGGLLGTAGNSASALGGAISTSSKLGWI